MRLNNLVLIIIFALCSSSILASYNTDYQQCLVIGQEADPSKARNLLREALESWRRGMRSAAVELYERAVIADHSILRHEDHGLAMALLEKYRDKNMPQTAAALCRRGFFENILIGNLEESMKFYEKAAAAASNPDETQLASDEAKRLREQLAYIREWQQSVIRENRIIRERERQQYIRQTAQEELRTQVNEISDEVSELQERLAFLQKQEKEVMENMYSSMRNAARYRRRYYYPGLYSDATPDPSPRDGSAAPAGSTDMAPGANPYAGQGTSVIPSNVSLNRFYIYRNRARREEDQLAQIRAEISGLQRRVAELQKSSKELREKANPSAVR